MKKCKCTCFLKYVSACCIYIFLCFFYELETGGITISPRPSEEGAEILPAMPMRPFFGIKPALVDKNVSLLACNLFIFHKV